MFDRFGRAIHELRLDAEGRRLAWVELKDISPALQKAVIFSEDRRFYTHSGVDWVAVWAAVVRNIFGRSPRGASTITMQLAAILDAELKPKNKKKTLKQKWNQIKAASEIENKWTKDEILEAYLNLLTFRGELEGIGSASRGLFNKFPEGLDDAESALLASLIPSPNASSENVIRRGCRLSAAMSSGVPCDRIKTAAESALSGRYFIRAQKAIAPHVAIQLLRRGHDEVSTLDGRLQEFAMESLRRQLDFLKLQNVNEGAVVVLDNQTGDVLAYVGNAGDTHVDGVRAKRQAGSTLKPFLYAIALEDRMLTAASLIEDGPLDVPTDRGIYSPEDYDRDYKGLVPVRVALASSLNTPAIRVLSIITPGLLVKRLVDLGLSGLKEEGDYGLSLALGTADVSLWEMANGYRTLANKGIWSPARLVPGTGLPTRRVFKEETAFIVSDILSDREARSGTFGFENPLSTRFWTAVKTGTSKDMRDNWAIGYSDRYTVGVWVGNFSGEPMWNVSGISGAAPVWLEIMNYLHKNTAVMPPDAPHGVVRSADNLSCPPVAGRMEWFIRGTEPIIKTERNLESPKILYPVKGAIIALDPDIPGGLQRIFFDAGAARESLKWVLNGKVIGSLHEIVSWRPKKGNYTISLVNSENRVVDSVNFKVKGN